MKSAKVSWPVLKEPHCPPNKLPYLCNDQLSKLKLKIVFTYSLHALLKHLLEIKITNSASFLVPYLCHFFSLQECPCGRSRTNGIKTYYLAFHVRRFNVSDAFYSKDYMLTFRKFLLEISVRISRLLSRSLSCSRTLLISHNYL